MENQSGIRKFLSYPLVYSTLQKVLGAEQGKRRLIEDYIKPNEGDALLDIGCGPAEILKYLPDVVYFGFDTNAHYITSAREKYGNRGTFKCKNLDAGDLKDLPPIDVAIMVGVLHHLEDDEAIEAMSLAKRVLKPGGRFIAQDPCICPGQHLVAKIMIANDRGQNVRDEQGYINLTQKVFPKVTTEIIHSVHRKWIPNTHCFTVCEKT